MGVAGRDAPDFESGRDSAAIEEADRQPHRPRLPSSSRGDKPGYRQHAIIPYAYDLLRQGWR